MTRGWFDVRGHHSRMSLTEHQLLRLLARSSLRLPACHLNASSDTVFIAGAGLFDRERLPLEEEPRVTRLLPPIHPRNFRGATQIATCIKCKGTRAHKSRPCPRCNGLGVVRVPHPRYLMLRNSRDDLMAKARRTLNPPGGAARLGDTAQAASYVARARAFNRDLVRFLKSKYNRGVRR
jgi:hypothetical protein